MYEARQNKEKVSRRIDAGDNRAQQRVKLNNGVNHLLGMSFQFGGRIRGNNYDPDFIKISDIRYWKANPKTFNPGQGHRMNSNNSKYKKTVLYTKNEVHATIDNMPEIDIRTFNPNPLPKTFKRSYVSSWHISVRSGGYNLGGWFGLGNNTNVLNQYTKNTNHNVTNAEIQCANSILRNMKRYIL